LRLTEPQKGRGQELEEYVASLSIPEHIATLKHTGIVRVHGDWGAELLAKIDGIASVIKIAMRQDDQLEIARLTARAGEFFFNCGALIRTARVDQEIAGVGGDEITIDTA